MAVAPLNNDEELVWRNLMQLVFNLPRELGDDLQRSCGLSSTDYSVLMHLSEAPKGQLYMSELARRTNLSPSRISRVINDLARIGLVERRPGPLDAAHHVRRPHEARPCESPTRLASSSSERPTARIRPPHPRGCPRAGSDTAAARRRRRDPWTNDRSRLTLGWRCSPTADAQLEGRCPLGAGSSF